MGTHLSPLRRTGLHRLWRCWLLPRNNDDRSAVVTLAHQTEETKP
jgi:hypothetical protein